MNVRDDDHRAVVWKVHHELQAGGSDFWPVVPIKPLAPFFGFERSIVFQRVAAWNEVVNGPDDAKLATLADPAWRDRARSEWDHRTRSSPLAPRPSRRDDPRHLRDRRRTARHLARRVRRAAPPPHLGRAGGVGDRQRHPLDHGRHARSVSPRTTSSPRSANRARSPTSTTAARTCSCSAGAGEHLYLLTHYVRDRGLLTRGGGGPRAHRAHGGVLRVVRPRGDRARQGTATSRSSPSTRSSSATRNVGTTSRTAPGASPARPAGFRATVVAGTPTWLDGADTGERPGGFIRPG